MLRLVTRIEKHFARTKNFFSFNPIYPDMGEKDFDIYNSERKTIGVLDFIQSKKAHRNKIKDVIKDKMNDSNIENTPTLQAHELSSSNSTEASLMKKYADLIAYYNKKRESSHKVQSQFKTILTQLIHKFSVKSEVQLVRLFRIGIAHQKKKQLVNKLRGQILQSVVMEASKQKSFDLPQREETEDSKFEDKEFDHILEQLDEKIEKIQMELNLSKRNIKRYDEDYGWEQQRIQQFNEESDLFLKKGFIKSIATEPIETHTNFQNWSIKSRINKLFFFKHIQHLKKNTIEELPKFPLLNLSENMVNKIAYRYQEPELYIEGNLNEIYQQIDLLLDKIFIKIDPIQEDQTNNCMKFADYQSSEYLWENLNVEEVFCNQFYSDQNKIQIYPEEQSTFSPSANLQLSLNRLPVNLHRHSEVDIFHMFTGEKKRAMKKLIQGSTSSFPKSYESFQFEKAQRKFEKIEKNQVQSTSSFGRAKRKKSEAMAEIKPGKGSILVNNIPIQNYFPEIYYRVQTLKPLLYTETAGKMDVILNVVGGGLHGQSQCMAYALSRALMKMNQKYRINLSKVGMAGNDRRRKQSKKPNLYSARVRPPYVRR